MSKYVAKAAIRQAKNYTKGYSDIQVKVREATSNDPWGPSGSQMTEISEATFNAHEFMEIMDMIDKRLNDSGKNWKHVFKALTLLDYLIHCGSEQVIAYAKQNLYVIKTLKEFQFIDDDGRDQGANVREKSKNIAALLSDDERLREERQKRSALRERMGGASSIGGGAGSAASNYGGHRRNQDAFSSGSMQRKASYAPSTAYEEEKQLERALEESRRTALEQERQQREDQHDRELQSALDSSRKQQDLFSNQSMQQETAMAPPPQQQQQVDLWGSNTDQQKNDFDFFSSMATTAPAQQSQPDPFGFAATPVQSQAPPPQQQIDFFQPQTTMADASQFNPFGGAPAPQQQIVPQNQMVAFGSAPVQPQQNQFLQQSSGAGDLFSIDAAFDTGAGQKNLVPRYVQGQSDANAQLAQIARNSSQIDAFANLAANSNPGSQKGSLTDLSFPTSGSSKPAFSTLQPTPVNAPTSFSQPPLQQQQSRAGMGTTSVFQQPQTSVFDMGNNQVNLSKTGVTNGSDPFAALSPFPAKPGGASAPVSQQKSLNTLGSMSASPSMMQTGGLAQQSNPFGMQQQKSQMMGGNFGFNQQPSQQGFTNPSAPPMFPQQNQFGVQQQKQQPNNDFFF